MKSLLEIRWIALIMLSAVVLWLAYFVFHDGGRQSSDLLVCQGEKESGCPPHTHFLECEADVAALAKDRCGRFAVMPAAEASALGGKCDYKITRVICEKK